MAGVKKLTCDEFSKAIRLGHGRTILHLREYGDNGIEDEIKKALLVNYTYDVCVEGLRSSWLWQIIMLTGRAKYYGDYLLNNFCKSLDSHFDIIQQHELASMFFDLGQVEFRKVILDTFPKVANQTYMSYSGRAIVEVSSLAGLEYVAKTCGASKEALDDYECSNILEYANELCGNVMEHMSQLATTDTSVKKFMDACEQFKIASSKTGERTSTRPTLIDCLSSDITRVPDAAARALANSKSSQVRDVALTMLKSGKSSDTAVALELLKNNYIAEDADIIYGSLSCLESDDDIHSAEIAVLNICDNLGGEELVPTMLWLYENGVETFCRGSIISWLAKLEKCPEDILYEAQWDAGIEARESARGVLSGR